MNALHLWQSVCHQLHVDYGDPSSSSTGESTEKEMINIRDALALGIACFSISRRLLLNATPPQLFSAPIICNHMWALVSLAWKKQTPPRLPPPHTEEHDNRDAWFRSQPDWLQLEVLPEVDDVDRAERMVIKMMSKDKHTMLLGPWTVPGIHPLTPFVFQSHYRTPPPSSSSSSSSSSPPPVLDEAEKKQSLCGLELAGLLIQCTEKSYAMLTNKARWLNTMWTSHASELGNAFCMSKVRRHIVTKLMAAATHMEKTQTICTFSFAATSVDVAPFPITPRH